MNNFRKRPLLVAARQFTASSMYDVLNWIRTQGGTATEGADALGPVLVIRTLEGSMTAHPGDWIVRGVRAEFHPVRGDIFAETYEPADGELAAPTADRAALRDRIAEALANADGLELGETESFPFLHEGQVAGYRRRADAVLSVLPAPADRAADMPRTCAHCGEPITRPTAWTSRLDPDGTERSYHLATTYPECQAAARAGRRVYVWAQTIDTADGGRTVHIPGTHHSGHGPETTAIVVSREDVPTLRAMLVDAAETGDESDYPRDPDAEEILNTLPPEAQRNIRAQLAAEARQDGAQPS